MLRLDQMEEEAYFKALIYGRSGHGKTSLVMTAPDPLYLLSERQALEHIKQACKRLKLPMPPVLYCESVDDVKAITRACRGDKTKPFRVVRKYKDGDGFKEVVLAELEKWPKTLGVDSFTNIAKMIESDLDVQAPPKMGSDNLPVRAPNYWGTLRSRILQSAEAFRDLPLHVIMLCRLDDKEIGDDDAKRRWVGPAMPMRSIAEELPSIFNFVGVAYRRTLRRQVSPGKFVVDLHYGVQTVGPEHMITKPCRPLRDHEPPNFARWLDVISGKAEAQPAPPPMTEMDPNGEATRVEAEEQQQETSKPKQPAQPKKAKK